MGNLYKRRYMKERLYQTLVVILLLAVITGIVAYTWMGLLELVRHFNGALLERLLDFNVF